MHLFVAYLSDIFSAKEDKQESIHEMIALKLIATTMILIIEGISTQSLKDKIRIYFDCPLTNTRT